MFGKRGKRGISTLVATVILILIVIVAIGIIWGALGPIISNSSEISQACSRASLAIDTSQGYSCYDENANELVLMISRIGDVEIAGAQLILSAGATSKAYEFAQGRIYSDVRMYYQDEYRLPIDVPKSNEDLAYVIDATGLGNVTDVKLAPIIKVGITEKKCPLASKVSLRKCSSVSQVLFDGMNITGEV